MSNMTRKELDERIEKYVDAHQYIDGDLRPVASNEYQDEFKQLIRDVIAAVTPEKIAIEAPSLGYRGDAAGRILLENWRKGRNEVIETIQQNTKDLLG